MTIATHQNQTQLPISQSSKQCALVTGASTGIGYEIALELARQGYDIIAIARSSDKLQSLEQEIQKSTQRKCFILTADLSISESPAQIFSLTQEILIKNNLRLEVLVNNAGIGVFGAFKNTPWEKEKEMLQLNMLSLAEMTKIFLPELLKSQKGYILQIASIAAFLPGPWMSLYYATKSFVLSFGVALNEELKGTGVSVTTYCPGPTQSEFFKRAKIENNVTRFSIMPTSKEVALNAIRATFARDALCVDGVSNRIVTLLVRLFPKSWAAKIVSLVQKAVKKPAKDKMST